MSIVHTEWIDPDGLLAVQSKLRAALETSLSKKQLLHVQFLLRYLKCVDVTYGPTVCGPLGLPARPLVCTYSQVRGGRMHCRAYQGPKWNAVDYSYICGQGMPNALRPFLMGKWGHDIDIENCHVSIMYQVGASYHTWAEHDAGVRPLKLDTMRMLYTARDDFIELIADRHMLPTDAERYPGYRKHTCKPLLMRILYGGSYDAWLKEQNMYFGPRSPHVVRLQSEIFDLRRVLLSSKRFAHIAGQERESQRRRGRENEAANRGAFAKIAQQLECQILLSMRSWLLQDGWNVHSLIFDGLIVEHRADATLDLAALQQHVQDDTDFKLVMHEKPLFRVQPADESLLA